jgi:hypothetical protein
MKRSADMQSHASKDLDRPCGLSTVQVFISHTSAHKLETNMAQPDSSSDRSDHIESIIDSIYAARAADIADGLPPQDVVVDAKAITRLHNVTGEVVFGSVHIGQDRSAPGQLEQLCATLVELEALGCKITIE